MKNTNMASSEAINKTIKSLEKNGIKATLVDTGAEALEKIKNLIPDNASIMNGSSITLEQIGLVDLLKSGNHKWNNLHDKIIEEQDEKKKTIMRHQAVLSDYYLGSVHALTENGELVIASNTGSQLPHIVYTSPNLIFVASTKKITSNLDDAMKRLEEHVLPLENDRAMKAYGFPTILAKIVILKKENSAMGRKINLILVNEDLGF